VLPSIAPPSSYQACAPYKRFGPLVGFGSPIGGGIGVGSAGFGSSGGSPTGGLRFLLGGFIGGFFGSLGGSRRGASRLRSICGSVVLCGLLGINYFAPLILLVAAAWIPSLHLTLATHVLTPDRASTRLPTEVLLLWALPLADTLVRITDNLVGRRDISLEHTMH
jgi:hypothetical protein